MRYRALVLRTRVYWISGSVDLFEENSFRTYAANNFKTVILAEKCLVQTSFCLVTGNSGSIALGLQKM